MANLIVNPGFETGNLAGWSVSNGTCSVTSNPPDVYAGTYAAQVGAVGTTVVSVLNQLTSTGLPPGAMYKISFWYKSGILSKEGLAASFGIQDGSGNQFNEFLVPNTPGVYEEVIRYYTITTNPNPGFRYLYIGFGSLPTLFGSERTVTFFDQVSITPFTICYSGESLVQKLNGEDHEIVKIKDVQAGDLLLNHRGAYVPITTTTSFPSGNRIYVIPEKSIDSETPSEDLEISGGHYVMYQGKPTKVRDVPVARRSDIPIEKVYTFCTDLKEYIMINNLPVKSYSQDEWHELYVSKML